MTINEKDLTDPMYWIRWSINAGIVSDQAKKALYGAGLIHHMIRAIDLDIDYNQKTIKYILYLDPKLYSAYAAYLRLKPKGGIISLWRTKRLLKKYGNLEFLSLIAKDIQMICGENWQVGLGVKKEEEYFESGGFEEIGSDSRSYE